MRTICATGAAAMAVLCHRSHRIPGMRTRLRDVPGGLLPVHARLFKRTRVPG
jgi:hypothetical protein